jgi:hypothetical protein
MYGTVALATVADGDGAHGAHEVLDAVRRWLRERAPRIPGVVAESVLVADDHRTVVMAARFRDRSAFEELARDPAQQAFYDRHFAPLFAEVRWEDGDWEVLDAGSWWTSSTGRCPPGARRRLRS